MLGGKLLCTVQYKVDSEHSDLLHSEATVTYSWSTYTHLFGTLYILEYKASITH